MRAARQGLMQSGVAYLWPGGASTREVSVQRSGAQTM